MKDWNYYYSYSCCGYNCFVALAFPYAYYKYGSKQTQSQPKEPEIVPKETEIVPSEQPTKELPQEASKENLDQLSVASTRSYATN